MTMTNRNAVIAEARQWIGTPYAHQQMVRGLGCDCVGLIRGVGIATGVMPERRDDWARFNAYGRRPNPRRMLEGMHTFLVPLADGVEPQPGDIAWVQWRENLPMHLALWATDVRGQPQLIHSFSDVGRVVAHGINDLWRNRFVSFWSYPGVSE